MPGERPKFNHRELAILTMLRGRKHHPYTTNEIAKNLSMSWNSTEETLQRLFRRGYLMRGKRCGGRVTRWKLVSR